MKYLLILTLAFVGCKSKNFCDHTECNKHINELKNNIELLRRSAEFKQGIIDRYHNLILEQTSRYGK